MTTAVSICKICHFELGIDEGWGTQLCDSCEDEIRLHDHDLQCELAEQDLDGEDDDEDDRDVGEEIAADLEAMTLPARQKAAFLRGEAIGVEKRSP